MKYFESFVYFKYAIFMMEQTIKKVIVKPGCGEKNRLWLQQTLKKYYAWITSKDQISSG